MSVPRSVFSDSSKRSKLQGPRQPSPAAQRLYRAVMLIDWDGLVLGGGGDDCFVMILKRKQSCLS